MRPEIIVRLLALLTLLSNVIVLLYLLFYFFNRLGFAKDVWQKINKFLSGRVILYSFIVALTATSGSLYFSEIAGFTPCILCWYQRIFMYPLVLVLGVGLFTKSKDVWKYVLPLSLVGLSVAFYHYNLQINPSLLAPCTTIGFSASCSERFVTEFGYITIPWMAFSAFALVTIAMLLLKSRKN